MQTSSPRLGPGAAGSRGLPVPHELYGEMTLESLVDVMAAIGLDLRTERLN